VEAGREEQRPGQDPGGGGDCGILRPAAR